MKEGDRVVIRRDPSKQVFTIVRIEQWDRRVAVIEDADRRSYKVAVRELTYAI